MKNKAFQTYLAEGLLIVFSVLFALFINKLFDDYKTKQRMEVALDSIVREVERNEGVVQEWKKKHIAIRERISSMTNGENDSIIQALQAQPFFDLGILTNAESLIDNTLTKTAWESAKSTGIIGEFKFETIELLTQVYGLQDLVIEKTVTELLRYYFTTEVHDLEQVDQTLIQFQHTFYELTGQ